MHLILLPLQFLFFVWQGSLGDRPVLLPTPLVTSTPSAQAIVEQGLSTGIIDYLYNPFVIFIWALFLASVVAIIRYLLQLPKQHSELDRVQENYNALLQTLESSPDAIREELLKNVTSGSIAAQRVEELHWISTHGGDFDQLALAEVVAAREGARTSIARYGASVLVLLGLCGAIWGLSNLVFQMGPELRNMEALARNSGNAQSSAPIQESVGILISTMATALQHTKGAFYASLTGIILSVILLFLNWIISRHQVLFLTALEDLTATRLIPILKPPRESSELAGVVESFKEGSNYVNRLSDQVEFNLKQVGGNLENLFAIVRKFGEGADALQVNQKGVFDAQTRMLDVVEEFTGVTERLEGHQAGARERIEEVVGAVQLSNKNFTRAISEWQQKHESLLQLIQQTSKQAHQEAKEARDLAQKAIDETTDLFKTSIDRQLNELRVQALEMLNTQQVGNHKHLAEIVGKQGEFVSTLQAAILNGNGHRELLEGVNKVMNEERDLFSERFDQMRQEELAVFSERLDKMLDQNERVIAAMKEVKAAQDLSFARSAQPYVQESLSGSSDNAPLIAIQEQLIKGVGPLRYHLESLTSLLIVLIGLIGFAVPVLGALGIMYKFDLWPSDLVWQIVTLVVILLGSGLLSFGLTNVLRKESASPYW